MAGFPHSSRIEYTDIANLLTEVCHAPGGCSHAGASFWPADVRQAPFAPAGSGPARSSPGRCVLPLCGRLPGPIYWATSIGFSAAIHLSKTTDLPYTNKYTNGPRDVNEKIYGRKKLPLARPLGRIQ